MNYFEQRIFDKRPAENLDYDLDLSNYLPSTDSISSAVSTVSPNGLAVGTTTINNTLKTVKQWLSGGADDTTYGVSVVIGTTEGRSIKVKFKIRVKEA